LYIFTEETLVAVAGALGGGVLVKLVDRWYRLKEKGIDVNEAFRKDARLDIVSLKDELREAYKEYEIWQEKYYKLFEEKARLKAEHLVTLEELANERKSHLKDIRKDGE
jgi:dsDNA-specific endonuclease/ATPase MutS2